MEINTSMGIEDMGNQTYIVGREGHIFINDPTVSKKSSTTQLSARSMLRYRLKTVKFTYGTWDLPTAHTWLKTRGSYRSKRAMFSLNRR